ncbi:MAG TPA: RNA 2',3'-cyclic phosphodiesterase [Armatimonadota bacterium]
MRTFVAIAAPALGAPADFLAACQQALRRGAPNVKWVAPGQFHITLRFLGDIGEPDLLAARDAVMIAAAAVAPFEVELGGWGAFPNARQPKTLWAGLTAGGAEAGAVEQALSRALADAGFPPELKPFHPHVTLGRVRPGASAAPLAGTPPPPARFTAARITLYESELSPQGPRYTPLLEAPFTGPITANQR